MKRLLLPCFIFISLILLSSHANAQRVEDVVYLSNGSIIHGMIIGDRDSQIIRILNHEGDIWAFNSNDIDTIKREKPVEFKAMRFNQPGIEVNINSEFLLRSGNNAIGKAAVPGLNLGVGYRFNQYISAGTEIGMEFYDFMEIPLSASLRLRTSGRALSQLLFLRAGYTLPGEKRADDWDYSYKSYGGVHTSIGAGIERILSDKASFLFTFSYHYQELNYDLTPLHQWVQPRDRKEAYSRLRISLGYVFK